MKKLLLTLIIALTLSGLSTLGQGYFALSGPVRGVWDGYTSGLMRLGATMEVAVLWGPTNATPLVDSIQISTPTNAIHELNYNAAWNDILTDPNFHLAVDANTSALVLAQTAAVGSWVYTTTGGFDSVPINGTVPGTSYNVFVIGWDRTFTTPQLAATAGSVVGWSAPFKYTATDSIGTPLTLSAAGFTPFGVSVPEPSAFALAGLALMLFRRNKVE